MRSEDKAEIWASSRRKPEQALTEGLARSEKKWTVIIDDKPASMFGVVPRGMITLVGVPWFLSTPAAPAHWFEFAKESRRYIRLMQEGYEMLENFVHGKNRAAIRWLRWLGFAMDKKHVRRDGEKFYRFWRDDSHV